MVKVSHLTILELINIIKKHNVNGVYVNSTAALEILADAYLEKCEELEQALKAHAVDLLVGRRL